MLLRKGTSRWPIVVSAPAWAGQVVSSIPGSDGYISHIHWAYDYLDPFGVLWVHMAWHKKCVKKNVKMMTLLLISSRKPNVHCALCIHWNRRRQHSTCRICIPCVLWTKLIAPTITSNTGICWLDIITAALLDLILPVLSDCAVIMWLIPRVCFTPLCVFYVDVMLCCTVHSVYNIE